VPCPNCHCHHPCPPSQLHAISHPVIPRILDPTPQKSLTQSNPRSWNLRRRAGRWDRNLRALIRRPPWACSEAFWKRRWQTLAHAAPSLKAAVSWPYSKVQGSAAARLPQESVESVAREGRGSPRRRHANKLLAAAVSGVQRPWAGDGAENVGSMLHLLQPSTVPLDLCLTAQSIAATPLSTVSGLSLAD
jgi:hypothetical protein